MYGTGSCQSSVEYYIAYYVCQFEREVMYNASICVFLKLSIQNTVCFPKSLTFM